MNIHSNSNSNLLEEAEHNMKQIAIPNGPSESCMANILQQIDSAQLTRLPLKLISRRRVVSLAAVLAIAAAGVFMILRFPSSSFALDELTKAIRNAKTLKYRVITNSSAAGEAKGQNSTVEFTMLYKDPGMTRVEHQDGMVSITNLQTRQVVSLSPKTKMATRIELQNMDGPLSESSMSGFPIGLLEQGSKDGKSIGTRMINGKSAVGFEVQAGAVKIKVWGDPETKLPVELEQTVQIADTPTIVTMKDFEFGLDLADDLFATEIPAGYSTQEKSFPPVNFASVSNPPEVHAVNIMKLYASRFDGKLPKQIDDPGLIANLMSSFGADLEGAKKAIAELVPSMGASWIFRASLKNFGYTGDPKLGEADKIVFWYLPEGAETYRVVYGDMRIGDVAADKIPSKK